MFIQQIYTYINLQYYKLLKHTTLLLRLQVQVRQTNKHNKNKKDELIAH